MENKLARIMRNTGPARFFAPIGIVLIIFGIILLTLHTGDYLQTTGKVTTVTENINSDGQTEYDVSLSYTVDGKEHTGTFVGLTEAYQAGDEIEVYYDAENPERISNGKLGGFVAPVMIGLGAVSLCFGIYKTVQAFKKSAALDDSIPGGTAAAFSGFDGFKNAPGVTEYYCRHDGNTFRPGYIIENAARTVLFEGKMLKNSPIGARTFEFNDHTTGKVAQHAVGHTVTQSYNDEFFSISSSFKLDGKNIWDVLHERGLRLKTDLHSKFPYFIYEVIRNGAPFARIESSSAYVHEDEAAQHKLAIPTGSYYYRVWTNSNDLESLFLTILALSETQQAVVE